jgi:UDP-N-acetylmuramoyl-tripeptide--D-alanyl-D-alanine ligase
MSMAMTVADLLSIPHVRAPGLDGLVARRPRAVCTDSREVGRGDVFVAFRGARTDGHDLVPSVAAAGALLCVVEERWVRRHRADVQGLPLLVVRDTVAAYGDIARVYRGLHAAVPLVAITGSNGKTGTKEYVAAALRTAHRVLHTEGNLNNHLGLPATLLRLRPAHGIIVAEMGTNQPGDIAYLCGIARPSCAVVTNIGRAHIEKLLSREGIAAEKSGVFGALPKEGVAVVNADEPLLRGRVPRGRHVIRFGAARTADVRIAEVTLDDAGRPRVRVEAPAFTAEALRFTLRARGRHGAWNAAAALAVGFAHGCDGAAMARAIARAGGVDRRLEPLRAGGVTILNDTYNANPDSVLAALDLLTSMKVDGARAVVLGDMLELGAAARGEHEALGRAVAALGIPYVLTLGRHSAAISRAARPDARFAAHYRDRTELAAALDALLVPGDAVLVKGSRGMRMEEIVTAFLHSRAGEEDQA